MSERAPVHKRQRRPWRLALRAVLRDQDAATAIEYGLVVSLIVITMLASLQGVANTTVALWNNVGNRVQSPR